MQWATISLVANIVMPPEINFTIPTFNGVFNGVNNFGSGSHSITFTAVGTENVGLFGTLTGTVQNLNVTATVTGDNRVGAIAGRNHGGTINNVVTMHGTTISGNNNVGGIVGYNEYIASDGTGHVNDSTFQGTINAPVGSDYGYFIGGGEDRGGNNTSINPSIVHPSYDSIADFSIVMEEFELLPLEYYYVEEDIPDIKEPDYEETDLKEPEEDDEEEEPEEPKIKEEDEEEEDSSDEEDTENDDDPDDDDPDDSDTAPIEDSYEFDYSYAGSGKLVQI